MGTFVRVGASEATGFGKKFLKGMEKVIDDTSTKGGYAIYKSGIGNFGAKASKDIAKAGVYGSMIGGTIGTISSLDDYDNGIINGAAHTVMNDGLGSLAGAGIGTIAMAIAKGIR